MASSAKIFPMELDYLKANLENTAKLIQKIKSAKMPIDKKAVSLFDIDNHDVMNIQQRPKRQVRRTVMGADGKPMENSDGEKVTELVYIEVERIPLAIQKFIVEQRMNMLLADEMELDSAPANETETALLESLRKAWQKGKVAYELREIITRQMSECEVAVLLSTEDAEEGFWDGTPMDGANKKIRFNILTSAGGESLFPVFNQYKEMIAFCREYGLKDDETGKDVIHFDLYTAEKNYYFRQGEGAWMEAKASEINIDGKIPVIYFSQKAVEWADEQPLINRQETAGSDHGESNKRVAFPITLFTAETIESLPEADDPTKAIQLTGKDASASYLEAKGAPESLKMEYEKLAANTDKFSGTIDFNTLHNFFGSAPSGYAIKLLFQPAHMKAAQKVGDFGKGVQRLINLYKSLLCGLKRELKSAKNMNIAPSFNLYLPKNDAEDVQTLINAKNAGLISHETAVMKCPLVKDTAAEWEKVKKESQEAEIKAKELAMAGSVGKDGLKVA